MAATKQPSQPRLRAERRCWGRLTIAGLTIGVSAAAGHWNPQPSMSQSSIGRGHLARNYKSSLLKLPVVAAAICWKDSPRSSASFRAVSSTNAGSFRLPRLEAGAK